MKRLLTAAALLGVLLIPACSESAPESPSSGEVQASWASQQQTSTAPPVDVNAQGRRVLAVGDTGGVKGQYSFTVTDVHRAPTCAGNIAEPPENGQYVFLTLDVQTEPGFSDPYNSNQVMLNQNGFNGILDTGLTYPDVAEGNSLWCEADGTEALSLTDWAPSSHYRGTYVFDVPTNLKAIVIPANVGFNGWEIPIP